MIKRLWKLGKEDRWRTYGQVLAMWCSEMLIVTVLWAAAGFYVSGRFSAPLIGVIAVQVVLSLVYLVWGTRAFSQRWAARASQELQRQFFARFFATTGESTHSVMTMLHGDLGTIKRLAVFYDVIIPTVLQLLLTGAVMVLTVLWIHPLTVLIPFAGIFLLSAGMGLLEAKGDRSNMAYVKSFNALGQRFLDDFKGMNTLVMYGRQKDYARSFAADSENFRQKTMNVLVYQLQTLTIMDFCLYGAIGWFLIAQGLAVQAGTLALPSAVLLSALVALWLIDFCKFGYFIHIFISMVPKLRAIFARIDAEASAVTGDTSASVGTLERIELHGAVGYDGSPLIDKAALELEPGSVIGLAGVSGSGKSTLAKVLMKQLKMLAGEVRVNEMPLEEIEATTWFETLGYLGPESVLFDGTIQENLLLSANAPADWREQLERLGLCTFVDRLPDGFDTPVGENGALLSPGQRQQIAVARVILAGKQAYIFDEITSNIDSDNAEIILAALKQLAETSIVLLITHRVLDIQQLDCVYWIEGQQMIAGSPDELLKTAPVFREIVTEQAALLAEVANA